MKNTIKTEVIVSVTIACNSHLYVLYISTLPSSHIPLQVSVKCILNRKSLILLSLKDGKHVHI